MENQNSNIDFMDIGFIEYHMNMSELSESTTELEFWGVVWNLTPEMKTAITEAGFNLRNELESDLIISITLSGLDFHDAPARADEMHKILRKILEAE